MKIMLVNNCYPFGSTGKIVYAIEQAILQQGHSAAVSFAWKDAAYENYSKHIYKYGFLLEKYFFAGMARLTGNQYGVSSFSTYRLLRQIQQEKPDIVHIHCVNTYSCNHYILLDWLKKHHIATVITEHAEYYYTGNCSHSFECDKWKSGCVKCPHKYRAIKSYVLNLTHYYWKKMQRALCGWGKNLQIVSVSAWQMERSLQSPITQDYRHCHIGNGINTQLFKPYSREQFLPLLTPLQEPFILFVTPGALTANKGGNFIYEIAKQMPHYQFIIVGCNPPKNHLPNMHFRGHTNNPVELAQWYSAARLTLLLSRRETFSLVTAESLCCATPVVGFQCGGAENIALPEFSEFVPYGRTDLLIETLKKWFHKPIDKIRLRQQAVQQYNVENMTQKYLQLFQEMYANVNRKG